ncbi:MAG: helix-turn-helix transcriptional regulator [Pseudonocardiaceae bacterium]
MTQERAWPAESSQATGRAIRHYRKERHMSAEQLAHAVSALGLRYTRTQVTNLETGRRDSVTVGEVYAFAAVLDVPPVVLLLPLGSGESVELLPDHSTDPWTAYRWLLGELPTGEIDKPPRLHINWLHPVIATYRRHHNGLRNFLHYGGGESALEMIAGARIRMQEQGWHRPPLPDDVTEALRPVLHALGWYEDKPGELVPVQAEDDDQAVNLAEPFPWSCCSSTPPLGESEAKP